MRTNKPIPTEYRGTRFRSKSEAVFARTLSLSGYAWLYECNEHGHRWDFLITKDHIKYYHVEYKPSRPTETYISNLRENVAGGIIEKGNIRDSDFHSLIVYGSPWQPVNGISYRERVITHQPDVLKCIEDPEYADSFIPCLAIFETHAQEAKRYRYDLVQ